MPCCMMNLQKKQDNLSRYSDLDVGPSIFKNKTMFWITISSSKSSLKCPLRAQDLYDL